MEIALLSGLALLGFCYAKKVSESPVKGMQMNSSVAPVPGKGLTNEVTQYKDPAPKYARDYFDMNEAGMVYGIEKPQNLAMANLNEAYKPWSAPSQTPTRSVAEFLSNQAMSQAYIEAHATPFYFNKNGETQLTTNQQSNPNVEIPSCASITGDKEQSLAYYPRVYVSSGEEVYKPTAEYRDGFLHEYQPTEMEMDRVQDEGRLNRDHNPWGPGGHYQRVFMPNHEAESRRRGVDRATMLSPVIY